MRYFLVLLVLILSACAAPRNGQEGQPAAVGKSIVEIRKGGANEYIWQSKAWSVTDLKSALVAEAKQRPISQIRLLDKSDVTVGNLLDLLTFTDAVGAKPYIWNSKLENFDAIQDLR